MTVDMIKEALIMISSKVGFMEVPLGFDIHLAQKALYNGVCSSHYIGLFQFIARTRRLL
jgi:hypothetical protein